MKRDFTYGFASYGAGLGLPLEPVPPVGAAAGADGFSLFASGEAAPDPLPGEEFPPDASVGGGAPASGGVEGLFLRK